MHLKDDLLRAYIDQEVSTTQGRLAQEHLSRCSACLKRLEEMTARANRVQSSMNSLLPSATEQPRSIQSAYKRFTGSQQLSSRRRHPTTKEFVNTMSTKRTVLTVLAALTVIALVFSFTPARAWASDLLGLFRVEKVQVITFDPAALDEADGRLNANREAIERVFEDDLQIQERGEKSELASVEEAASRVSFTPRVPAAMENAKITHQPGLDATFTIDQPKLQGLMDAVGADVQLPESVNGKVATVNVPDAVVFSSGCTDEELQREKMGGCDQVIQMLSPQVDAPEDLDVPQLGQAMFQFLGLPADEARELSQRIDWASTLVLPIPQSSEVKYSEVPVDGVTATLLEANDGAMLLWVKDGILYSVRTMGSADDALELAASLR